MRNSIPLAGAPTSIETSLRGLLFFCSARFLLVVSRKAACPAHQMVAVLRRRAVPGPVSEQPARRPLVSIALLGEEDARRVDAAEVQAQESRPFGGDGDARDLVAGVVEA